MNDTIPATGHLLGAADIRRIAADAGISPTKKFGQNFVIDPGTVRRIVREAGVTAADHVMEVGPGLGSLTLAILETGATMTAVEIDPPLAERLPGTVAEFMPEATSRLTVVNRDALTVTPENVPDFSDDASFTLVANLPYNVATPILLTLLERFDNLGSFLVMVQKEVADRLAAKPGSTGTRISSDRCGIRSASQDPARGIEDHCALRGILHRRHRSDPSRRDAHHRRIHRSGQGHRIVWRWR